MTGQAAASAAPTNSAATGQPTITGTAEGRADTHRGHFRHLRRQRAHKRGVQHQWVRSANGSDNDITDATASTYAVTNADIDTAIKVRVNFSDDDGYSESVTSTPRPQCRCLRRSSYRRKSLRLPKRQAIPRFPTTGT